MGTKLSWDPWMPPPPVSKMLAMRLRIVSLFCDTASRFTEFQCINISLIVYQ